MPAEILKISLIQPDIIWEDKAKNLLQYEQYLEGLHEQPEIVLLPEMFSTGFSMESDRLAETMEGETMEWLRNTSRKYRCIISGSLIIKEGEYYFNRLIWMQPDGVYGTYDKRHLFGYAGEDRHYSPGSGRLITSVKGWKICPLICYDLRFPVWSRNDSRHPFDILMYVANWPASRSLAWRTLLQARAIENQCYVVGVNRVGHDGNGNAYDGYSSVFAPSGEVLFQKAETPLAHSITLVRSQLNEVRERFPFLKDADRFALL